MCRNATSAACSNGDQLSYDVENRLTQVIKSLTTTNFGYNGDGARVSRQVVGTGTTYYIGDYFEVYVNGTTTFNKYYYFGAQRVAAKIASTLFYFQGDHLGSSSLVMTDLGALKTRQTYYPFGAQRTTEGSALPTDYTFTGQKNDDSTGLMFYGARYYDVTLGRFTQPDTIVPSPLNPQSLNRFSYVYNNPLRFMDPTGHQACGDGTDDPECNGGNTSAEDEAPADDNNGEVIAVPGADGGVLYYPTDGPDNCDIHRHAIGCGNNQKVRPEPTDEQKANAKKASMAGAFVNLVALNTSVAGGAAVAAGCIAGTVAEPGGGTVVGCGAGLLTYQAFNVAENAMGVVSTSLTIYADMQLGNDAFDPTDGELSIGQDTIASVMGTTIGIVFGNEPISDSIINGADTGYAFGRLTGAYPESPPFRIVSPLLKSLYDFATTVGQ